MASFFASPRERRLWGYALAVQVAIWAALGLAGRLAETLRDYGFLAPAFGLGFLLVIVSVAGISLGSRPRGREIWVLLGIAAVYGMVVVRMGVSWEERTHVFEYGLVALFVHAALVERRARGRRVPAPAVLAVLVTAALGWLDEGIQALLPGRVYDLRDVGFNALAGVMAVSAGSLLGWVRRWRERSKRPGGDGNG